MRQWLEENLHSHTWVGVVKITQQRCVQVGCDMRIVCLAIMTSEQSVWEQQCLGGLETRTLSGPATHTEECPLDNVNVVARVMSLA